MRPTGLPHQRAAYRRFSIRAAGRRRSRAWGLGGRTVGAAMGFWLAASGWPEGGTSLVEAIGPAPAAAQSLRGGRAVMVRQHNKGIELDYTPVRNAAQLRRFVKLDLLKHLPGNANYRLHDVSFPYARPEVKELVEQLSADYRKACGEQLVVTSLTRPLDEQPVNASPLSVHPRGMAVDLRRPNGECRDSLVYELRRYERLGVLDATQEENPPHYHVAVFGDEYGEYVATLQSGAQPSGATRVAQADIRYRVRRGDTLWDIARSHGTTVDQLRSVNNIRGDKILAGQTLRLTRPGTPD